MTVEGGGRLEVGERACRLPENGRRALLGEEVVRRGLKEGE